MGLGSQGTILVLFAYPIAAFVVWTDWGRVAHDTLALSLPHIRDVWSKLAAIRGTTINPYLFFRQASEEVERSEDARQTSVFPMEVNFEKGVHFQNCFHSEQF